MRTDTHYPKGSASPHSKGAAGTNSTCGSYGGSGGSTTSYKGGGSYFTKGTGRHRVTKASRNGASPSGATYPKSRHATFDQEKYY